MTQKANPKIVFIDTNIYINCAYEEFEDLNLDVLDKIIENLDSDKMILVLPEIIKSEVLVNLKNRFDKIKKAIPDSFSSISFKKELENNKSKTVSKLISKSKKYFIKEFEKSNKSTIDIIQKVITHKNTNIVPLTDQLVLRGINRSLLKKAPYSKMEKAYTKDCDCIAFETLKQYLTKLKNSKKYSCIICSDDSDYFKNIKENKLSEDIILEVEKLSGKIIGYNNPLEMLKNEFEATYSEEEVEKFKEEGVLRIWAHNIENTPERASRAAWASMLPENPHIHYCGMASSIISEGTKYCPVCDNDISKYVSGYMRGKRKRSNDYSALTASVMFSQRYDDFQCPYCKSEFYVN
ncbi:DUF4935 domain-containing protein [Candidatus Parcubacteria bacterium]|nr:DUF4935 domain-containing protein [Candidatus Parcubacteria bacterium]